MRARLSSRSFVGRVGELAELQLAVREAVDGAPALVLLGGDSGVGKTRLVAELRHRLTAGESPPLLLRGEAVAPSDGELPYAPLLAALRPLARDGDPVLGDLHPATRAQLATLLPGLTAGPPAPSPAAAPARDDGAAQLQLFEAVLALLHALAERRPVVLVLEDMHWADRSTRALVAFLARGLRDERVATVLTYRADELHRRHPLRPLLSELERVEGARRVDLPPLDRDELFDVLTDILGSAPPPALLARLFTRAEGNPLYTEELLAAGLDGRGAPPRSLSDAFLGRIERLSPDAQRAARAVAVGGALPESAIATVTGLEAGVLTPALREAVSAQVLVAAGDGDLDFRHALLREAVYDDLLPGERGRLHLALAEFLERDGAPGSLERSGQVAAHYAAGGDQRAALRTAVLAADAAVAARAPGDAAERYDRAMALWPRVPDAEALTGIDRVELLFRCADSLSFVSGRGRAEALLREALAALDPERDPARYAHALAEQARALWALNRGVEAIETGERALAMCPDADGAQAISIRAWLARLQVLRGRYRDARAEAQTALPAALAAGERGVEAELRDTLGQALVGLGDVEAGFASLRHAIALARDDDDPDRLSTSTHNLADDLGHVGRTAEALATAEAGLAELPAGHLRNRDWLSLTVSRFAFATGDWGLAERHLPPAGRMVGIIFMFRQLREAELAAAIGDDDRARGCLDSIADLVADSSEPQWIGPYNMLVAELQIRAGDLEGARHTVEDAIGRMEVCTDDVFRIVELSVAGLRIEADRAQRARDLGDATLKRDALARARVHDARLQASADDARPVVRAALAEARAEAARARGRPRATHWARAATAWEQLELPYRAAIARWREAECRAADGDRAGAAAAAGEALDVAGRLGSRWLARELRGLAERARLALADGDGTGDDDGRGEDAADADPFGLTERERQVLRLVAQGATNRQIGATLYMAEKTASVHVSRILAKLDVRSRTEAAAVAHRLALA